jgi:hypothetical protein
LLICWANTQITQGANAQIDGNIEFCPMCGIVKNPENFAFGDLITQTRNQFFEFSPVHTQSPFFVAG